MISREGYDKVFETLVEDIVNDISSVKMTEAMNHMEKLLRYYTPQATEFSIHFEYRICQRGWVVPALYWELCEHSATAEDIYLSYVLGWAWQITIAHLLALDDFLDRDESRWGKPSWSHLYGRQPIVANDVVLLQQGVTRLLCKYFGEKPALCKELVQFFSTISFEYSLGLCQEEKSKLKSDSDSAIASMTKYRGRIKYIVQQPLLGQIQLAMLLPRSHRIDDKILERVETICEDMAYYWALQDDLSDSFGVNLRNPLSYRDIKMGVCKSMLIKAKELCDLEQWETLRKSYGKEDDSSVEVVKEIYRELKLPELCKQHLVEMEEKLGKDIEELSMTENPFGIFLQRFLDWFCHEKE